MKCNWREIALLSKKKAANEGRLNYKKVHPGSSSYVNSSIFKERWFRLVNNYLVYYKINESGTFNSDEPAGLIVMENSFVKVEHRQSIPFSFSISFLDDTEKIHIFSARSEDDVARWVEMLSKCTYEYLRSRLHTLQAKIFELTGEDPLLMVPRNAGSQQWRPSVPFSSAPACSKSFGFHCHVHTNNNVFTLQKNRSSGNFYVPLESSRSSNLIDENGTCEILRKYEKCTPELTKKLPSVTTENPRALYSRSAPSPPVRKKNSPSTERNRSKSSVSNGFLVVNHSDCDVPLPPPRKVSPKMTAKYNGLEEQQTEKATNTSGSDLIKF